MNGTRFSLINEKFLRDFVFTTNDSLISFHATCMFLCKVVPYKKCVYNVNARQFDIINICYTISIYVEHYEYLETTKFKVLFFIC